MKNKLIRILTVSLVFVVLIISFIRIDAIEINTNNKTFIKYNIKEKEEVLVLNDNIFEFYENNYEKLNILIAEKQRELELLEQQKIFALKNELVEFSKQFIGNPYVSGGTSLTNGSDCSGFVQTIYRSFGYDLPRTTPEQAQVGTAISFEEIEIGDIVSYGYDGYVTHSALYIGDGMIIHASTPELGIRVDKINIMPIMTIRRVI